MAKPVHESASPRSRFRIVIVEDNFTVADALRICLEASGYIVVGLAGTIEGAEKLLEEAEFDVALLDVDLHGANVAPLARRLVERSKAFVFLTGYADNDILPPDLAAVTRLEKPADPDRIIAAIEAVGSCG